MSTQLIPFTTHDGQSLSALTHDDGSIWFLAAEVCRGLGIQNPSKACERLDTDEKDAITLSDSVGKPNKQLIISEPGFYRLALSARKEEARSFQRWVTHEILPQIRQTGKYESAPRVDGPSPIEKAQRDLTAWLAIAEMMQSPKSVALVEAVKHIKADHDVDLTPQLTSSAAMDDIPQEEMMLEPTALGQLLGMSGMHMNLLLARHGLQVKIGGTWTPTDKAHGLWVEHLWTKGGKSGYNKKWNVEHVRTLVVEGDGA